MFQPTGGPPGDIVRIPWTSATTHGAVQHLGGPGQFPLPGGIAVAPDGSVFVSVFSTSAVPGSGKVVRAVISG